MRERRTFNSRAGLELDAVFHRPEGAERACALYAHCFTCTKEIAAAVRVSKALAARGVGTLRFDFAGLGKSGGDFSETTFSSNVDDLFDVAAAMRAEGHTPSILIGHSLGGAAVLAAAPEIESVRAVATIGAPSSPAHIQHLFENEIQKIQDQGEAEVSLAGRPFVITEDFVEDVRQYNLQERLKRTRAGLLIMHSPEDQTVGIDEAAKIYMAARHPKSFISLPRTDHLLSDQPSADYAAGLIAAWSERYIEGATPAPGGGAAIPAG